MPRRTAWGRLIAGTRRGPQPARMGRLGTGTMSTFRQVFAAAAPPVSNPPVNTALPVVTNGSAFLETGAVLSTTNGTWTNTPTAYAYQWRRDGVAISGETANTYTVVTADIGADISCRVTATNADGSAAAVSAALGPVLTARMTPNDITGIVAWYDASIVGSVTETLGAVSQWDDQGPNGYDVGQSTGANQPLLVDNTFNGRPAIVFTSPSYLSTLANYTALISSFGYSVCAACTLDSSALTNARLVGWSNNNADSAAGGSRIIKDGSNTALARYLGTTGITPPVIAMTLDEPTLVSSCANRSTGVATIAKNGNTPVAGTCETPSLGYVRHSIGTGLGSSGSYTGAYYGGKIQCIVLVNGDFTANDTLRQLAEGIVAWRSGLEGSLPVGHTYKNGPPRV